jgi:CRP/FNR family cyclic AMP-dependent transcriptional regulator
MDEKNADRLERLKQINLFSDIAEDLPRLKAILDHTTISYVRKGDAIIREGGNGRQPVSSSIRQRQDNEKTVQDEDYTVVILHDHMNIYFGEIALVDNDRRSATVLAETNCELIKLTRKDFLAMAEADPLLGYRILSQIAKKLSGSLRKMNSDVITLFEALVTEVEGSGLSA